LADWAVIRDRPRLTGLAEKVRLGPSSWPALAHPDWSPPQSRENTQKRPEHVDRVRVPLVSTTRRSQKTKVGVLWGSGCRTVQVEFTG